MSYILDAIKKSDQQRQRGTTPTLQTQQATLETPRQPALFIYGLLAVVLITTGIVIGIQRPWQSDPVLPENKNTVEKPLESSQQAKTPAPQPHISSSNSRSENSRSAQKPVKTLAPALPSTQSTITQEPTAIAKAVTLEKPPLKTVAQQKEETVVPAMGQSAKPVVNSIPQEQKIMTIAELPPAIQQEIPKMAISVHVYSSKPKDRLVGINERLLREGDDLLTGLRLEQITQEDMVFGYKGFHFRRSIK
ncbi:general secretion pathway protein GspB [Sulfurirhabdus autotrophica]|uniref:Type II secretion system (T2SS) protein B n=1 Tax=Sulfurirhabdus autotrophica TaxID=1706046 RepID=A0A4R3Y525_9PROT|nr:general secretion pathway protein GspB [Sulfurirhabdus autotrophica]TCV87345.1 type II secretion system (T2SS) protein B [Sulfurirhabdus autotrophica]